MTADEVVNATKNYISDSNNAENKDRVENKTNGLIATKVAPIPLIHSKPLYLVMHPEVRRSARVRVVAEWLGEVMREMNSD